MKLPRTPHLPDSPGGTRDDRRLPDLNIFLGRRVVITEKMDGSSVCLTRKNLYARSHAGPPRHPSFDLLKARRAALDIPGEMAIYAEWLHAVHSIKYPSLDDYLQVFAIVERGKVIDWSSTMVMCDEMGLTTVPMLYDGLLPKNLEPYACSRREGFVARFRDSFPLAEWDKNVAKWVRAGHVQTDEHWSHGAWEKNGLAN